MSDSLARVIPLTPRTEPRRNPDIRVGRVVPIRGRASRRRQPLNGHLADCPYPKTNPEHCGICASERKAARLTEGNSR